MIDEELENNEVESVDEPHVEESGRVEVKLRKERKPKVEKPKLVRVQKVRGPKYLHDGELYSNGGIYEVTPEVAQFLISVRGQHGVQYFQLVD